MSTVTNSEHIAGPRPSRTAQKSSTTPWKHDASNVMLVDADWHGMIAVVSSSSIVPQSPVESGTPRNTSPANISQL